jgi:uncharacterized protein
MLPHNVKRIGPNDTFSFRCHAGNSCFTHCCRELELALTPYDVLRLKKATGLSSSSFLEKYVIIEREEKDAFPRLYLTMIDDGNASCVFVSSRGCNVYEDRPGACRAYPIGRAAVLTNRNSMEEFYVLLKENHCRGFNEPQNHTPKKYEHDQGLDSYNVLNDAVGSILQHEKIHQGMILTEKQSDIFITSLYDLDTFREMIKRNELGHTSFYISWQKKLDDDEALLLVALDWLKKELFGDE